MSEVSAMDPGVEAVLDAFRRADPLGERLGAVIRATFDQLYDGQRTGRFAPEQLSKTEKTHCGSLVEIYLRREFGDIVGDGHKLDFLIRGHEVDCKFSLKLGGWMLPPECFGEVLFVLHADDHRGVWSAGVIRASPQYLRAGVNRDAKSGLNVLGRSSIFWLTQGAELPPNVLLRLAEVDRAAVMAPTSGQQRINELFRRARLVPISRSTVATVAQQDDFMKRVRYNGGARSELRAEGYLIPGGDYESHRRIALELGAPDPGPGEFVSFRVVPAELHDPQTVSLDGLLWRIAREDEAITCPAPMLPTTRR